MSNAIHSWFQQYRRGRAWLQAKEAPGPAYTGLARFGRARERGTRTAIGVVPAALAVLSLLLAPGFAAGQTTTPPGFPTGQGDTYGGPLPPEPASAPGASSGSATQSPYSPTQQTPTTTQSVTTVTDQNDSTRQSGDQASSTERQTSTGAPLDPAAARLLEQAQRPRLPPAPDAFEKYVGQLLSHPIRRFGEMLTSGLGRDFTPNLATTVPPDYLMNAGDELLIRTSGSIDANLRLKIDSDGRIFIPRVGSVVVGGVRYGDLPKILTARVGEQFRTFKLSVSIAQLHGITVYVTGYAAQPGAYTLNSLSTLVNAVMAAGGPGPGGSFRTIQLRRGDEVVSDFDFYALLLNGDKTHDAVLQNNDVVFVGPAGPEVAISGSVNSEAIFEARPGETLGDMLRFAGGLDSLADDQHTYVERLSNLDKMGWQQLDLGAAMTLPIQRGDVVRVVSVADYARPQERQAVVVKIEGEVVHPGRYYLQPGATVADLLSQAGGLTPRAFVYGSELDRVTVRQQQQAGFDQAIQNIELSIAASPLTLAPTDTDPLGPAGRASVARGVVESLRSQTPNGRMVLGLSPDATSIPSDIVLENDDRLYIPPRPTTVGVFGAVYRPSSFAYQQTTTLAAYLRLAGGPLRIAESGDLFVVRANGEVVSRRQPGWTKTFDKQPALPGDVIFVPIKTQPNTLLERLLQVSALIYQLGFGAAALKVLTQ